MQLAREILDGGNDSWRGAIYGVADDGKMTVADGVETAPSGALGEYLEIIPPAIGMRCGENEEIRLEADHFLETHVRPVLRGVHDRGGPSEPQSIGNKRVSAGGDQWIRPNDEQNAARRNSIETLLEIGEMALEIGAQSGASFRRTEDTGKAFRRGDDVLHGMRIGAIRRNAEAVESVHCFDEIQTFGYEDEIRPQSSYLFEARIDRAADFGLFLSVGGIVAEVRVSDEAILQAESVNRFRETWRKRDDTLHGLRDANGAARFIDEFLVDR
jgi:hypothetical protein